MHTRILAGRLLDVMLFIYLSIRVPNKWRKYPRQGGQAQRHEQREGPQPQQQSSTGTAAQAHPFSTQEGGKQRIPSMLAMVHGQGSRAMSLPPTETTSTSFSEMLSRKNLSWGRSAKVRSFSVEASTAVLIAAVLCRRPLGSCSQRRFIQ
mmetsp:Transcript_27549/g.75858  ORF Transcript_27549/g.75858 Transcript_27549/m.75858 type:complete len:150 (+) Transcript_27549:530-979(+)